MAYLYLFLYPRKAHAFREWHSKKKKGKSWRFVVTMRMCFTIASRTSVKRTQQQLRSLHTTQYTWRRHWHGMEDGTKCVTWSWEKCTWKRFITEYVFECVPRYFFPRKANFTCACGVAIPLLVRSATTICAQVTEYEQPKSEDASRHSPYHCRCFDTRRFYV